MLLYSSPTSLRSQHHLHNLSEPARGQLLGMEDAHHVPPLGSGAFLGRPVTSERELVSTLTMASMLGRSAGQALWNDPFIFMEQVF